MISLKNNKLKTFNAKQLCKIHNGKKTLSLAVKSKTKKIHLLKRKDSKCLKYELIKKNTLAKKYIVAQKHRTDVWVTENAVIDWLKLTGFHIKIVSAHTYLLKNRICTLNNILVFANKKRIEMGLEPFYLEGLTEF